MFKSTVDAKISSYLFRYALMLINVLNNISPLRFDLSIILTFEGNKLMTESQVKIFLTANPSLVSYKCQENLFYPFRELNKIVNSK